MPQLASDIVKDRARRLRAKGEAAMRRHLDAQVGLTRKVLTEFNGIGRTEHFTPVRLAASVTPAMILDLTFAGHNGRQLLAA
jgi:threonylcarbamoyladenosine tRNA methylthiotransferase MtaB